MKRNLLLLSTIAALLMTGCTKDQNLPETMKDFENVSWADLVVTYDGAQHILGEVVGAPEGTTITYTGREYHSEVGTYEASAVLAKDGYYCLTLTSTLSITGCDFTGISFTNKNVVYDGTEQSIVCSNVPSFATVRYENNKATNAGTYNATATISADNYNTVVLHAILSITKADFSGITFNSATYGYDGYEKGITCSNVPSFADVQYKYNTGSEVGKYYAEATITAPNYNTLVLYATLTITENPLDLGSAHFDDVTIPYDGKEHTIAPQDLPYGCMYGYKSNNNYFTEAGTYPITVVIYKYGYTDVEMTATLTITPLDAPGSWKFKDRVFMYDGNNHSVEVTEPEYNYTVTYECLNQAGTNTFRSPGLYEVKATIKYSNNYVSYDTAKLIIIERPVGSYYGVDTSKTALTINSSLRWDTLYNALLADNFTMTKITGFYDTNTRDVDVDNYYGGYTTSEVFATDGKQSVSYFDNYKENENSGSTYYDFYIEHNDDMISFSFDESGNGGFAKMPKEAFSETVVRMKSCNAFNSLVKGANGEFERGVDFDSYYKDFGHAFVRDNKFIVINQHTTDRLSGQATKYRIFYTVYEFYNIGNTKVNVPNIANVVGDVSELGIMDYIIDGVKYGDATFQLTTNNYVHYWTAQIYLMFCQMVFTPKGVHTVRPLIYDHKVERVILTKLFYDDNDDFEGYGVNLWFNKNLEYQGEYAYLGKLDADMGTSKFEARGGVVHFYNEWANQ